MVEVRITVDGAELARRRGNGELLMLMQFKDSEGRLYDGDQLLYVIAMDYHVRPRRKNSIEMRRDDDNFLFIRAAQFPDDISGLIDLCGKPSVGKQFLYRQSTPRLLKGRSRNFRDARLLFVDPGNVGGKPVKRRADSRVIGKPGNLGLT